MSRGWTLHDDNDLTEDKIEEITPRLNALANEWSEIHGRFEEENLRRQMRHEDGDDLYDGTECPDCDGIGYLDASEDKLCQYCDGTGYDPEIMRFHQTERANQQLKLEIIENMLGTLGARMMRPYEHHNEDERYMEYTERDMNYGY